MPSLQELLASATLRPWNKDIMALVMLKAGGKQADGELSQHAVNYFEPLLEALADMLCIQEEGNVMNTDEPIIRDARAVLRAARMEE